MPGRTKKAPPPEAEVEMEDAPMEDALLTSAQESVENDSGDDDAVDQDDKDENDLPEEEEVEEAQRVRILPGSSSTAASFEFIKEGHTLGNALRYIIMKNPDVEFCAYAIPHPSEEKMNLRIQTYDTTTASAALEKGLKDLQDLCDAVSEEFWTKRQEFVAAQG
ncbi:DNA-directed RNA polymerase [Xylariaceae sp. FL0255]|nr:DNA-directed RNA polymerase [Xylariaceae sp. FL0255]